MPGEYWRICTGLDSEKEVSNDQSKSAPMDQDIDPGTGLSYA